MPGGPLTSARPLPPASMSGVRITNASWIVPKITPYNTLTLHHIRNCNAEGGQCFTLTLHVQGLFVTKQGLFLMHTCTWCKRWFAGVFGLLLASAAQGTALRHTYMSMLPPAIARCPMSWCRYNKVEYSMEQNVVKLNTHWQFTSLLEALMM
jgi:hypothetical protein